MNKYIKLYKEYKLVPSKAVIDDRIWVNKKTGAILRKRELKSGTLMYDILKS